jgi:hypothetical protein
MPKSKKQAAKTKDPQKLYEKWWDKTGSKKVTKIQKKWIKENEPNEPDSDDEGTDFWCVNNLMHNDDPHYATSEIANTVFLQGYNNQSWRLNQCESLYCELDGVIKEAYEAGKKANEPLKNKKTT